MTNPYEGNVLKLRRALVKALTDAGVPIGEYIIQNQDPVEAVNIGMAPPGTTVKGLEVLISPNPEVEELDGFVSPGMPASHKIRLINWGDDPDILEFAVNAIANAQNPDGTRIFWPFASFPTLVPSSEENVEQTNFQLYPPDA